MKWDGSAEIPVRRGDSVRISLSATTTTSSRLLSAGCVGCRLQNAGGHYLRGRYVQAQTDAGGQKGLPLRHPRNIAQGPGITHRLNIMGEQSLGAYRVTADTVASCSANCRNRASARFSVMRTASRCFTAACSLSADSTPAQVFKTGLNIISDQSLQQQKAENMRLRVKAVSLMPNNRKIKIEVGDKSDDHQTTLFPGTGKSRNQPPG